MKLEIEVVGQHGPEYGLTDWDFDKNIEALRRYLDGKPRANDFVALVDTISIIEGLKQDFIKKGN